MPIELIKNPLKVCRIIGENVFSTVVEEDINVPDVSPDLYRILASGANVLIKDCEVLADKVVVNGQVMVNVLYASDMEGRPLDSLDVSANFSQGIEIPGARPKMKETVNAVIQHVDCYMINSRKLNIKVIMDLYCRVEDLFDLELAMDVRGLSDIQVLRESNNFKYVAGHNRDQYEISDDMEIPNDSPAVGKILKTDFRVSLKEDKLSDGKIEVNGIIGSSILYSSADENRSIEYLEFETPFTQYIEVPAAERGMECVTDVALKECYADALEDSNGEKRLITVNSVLNINARVFKTAEEDVVVDAYSPSKVIDIGRSMFNMNELVGRCHSNMVVKESMGIKHGEPEIEKACHVGVMPVVNEVKVMDDKIAVEGVLECSAIYMSSYSAEPMCSMMEQLPFRHFLDIPGARVGMLNNVKCSVDSVSFSLINSEMLEVRIVVGISAEVTKHLEKRMVDNISEIEGEVPDLSRIPAVSIYLVQKGDTLWSIAKRYNTTVDALVKLNSIENPSRVPPGAQIMILKSTRIG